MISFASLVRAALGRLWLRFVSMGAVLLVSAATVAFGASLGSYSTAQAAATIDSGTALRTISVFRGAGIIDDGAVRYIRELDGVESAYPLLSVVVGLEYSRSVVTLFSLNPGIAPPLVDGQTAPELTEGQIILPARADGVDLTSLLGTETGITVTTAVTSDSGTTTIENQQVVALFDPSFEVDAPLAAYGNHDYVVRLAAMRQGVSVEQFLGQVGYDRLIVVMSDQADVAATTAELQREGFQAVSTLEQLDDVPGVVGLIRTVTLVVLCALGLLSLVTTLVICSSIAGQRRQEVAILKTYGWASPRIRALLLAEISIVAVAAIASGLLIGALVAMATGQGIRESLTDGQLGAFELPVPQLIFGGLVGVLVVLSAANAALSRAVREPVATVLRSIR